MYLRSSSSTDREVFFARANAQNHVPVKRKQSVKCVGHVYYRNRKDGFILKKNNLKVK